jgi:predicted metal-dependent HD superfamily phosphohydrolase
MTGLPLPEPDGTYMPEIQTMLNAAQTYSLPFYQESHRAYHTLAHVQAMLNALETRNVLTPALELAVWDHDLIYEAQSAERFGDWLETQRAGPVLVTEVRRLILETDHRAPPTDRVAALLVDADLSVFGADEAEFWRYEQAIWQEYSWVAWPAYRAGRLGVLEQFLRRDNVFSTPEFSGLEAEAQRHLEAARNILTGAPTENAAQQMRTARVQQSE